jgi:hypothetical protein
MDRKLAGLEKLLFVSILLTCVALLAENQLIKTRMVFQPGSTFPISLGDDSTNDGTSTAEWINEKAFEWRCTLRQQYQYPYCLLQVHFNGVDLSKYQTMKITLEYKGNGQATDSVRFYLRNNTPIYRQEGSVESLKYNEVEIPANRLNQPYVVHLDDFDIPDWWLRQYNIAPENAQTEFNDVIFFEITTGTGAPPGD